MHANRNIEPAFPQRHSGPELTFKLDLFVVMRGLVREYLGELLLWDAIEHSKLLLDEVDMFPTVELELVAMAFFGCRRHRFDTANHLVGCLPRSCVGGDPESGFRLRRVVIEEMPAQPFARSVGLLPSQIGERNCMVRQFKVLSLVEIAGRFAVADEKQPERRHTVPRASKVDTVIQIKPREVLD